MIARIASVQSNKGNCCKVIFMMLNKLHILRFCNTLSIKVLYCDTLLHVQATEMGNSFVQLNKYQLIKEMPSVMELVG